MNVLFLTLVSFESLNERNIYTDLLREFVKNGHRIYAISPVEKRAKQKIRLIREKDEVLLPVLTATRLPGESTKRFQEGYAAA